MVKKYPVSPFGSFRASLASAENGVVFGRGRVEKPFTNDEGSSEDKQVAYAGADHVGPAGKHLVLRHAARTAGTQPLLHLLKELGDSSGRLRCSLSRRDGGLAGGGWRDLRRGLNWRGYGGRLLKQRRRLQRHLRRYGMGLKYDRPGENRALVLQERQ
jgi:hypothetical protein